MPYNVQQYGPLGTQPLQPNYDAQRALLDWFLKNQGAVAAAGAAGTAGAAAPAAAGAAGAATGAGFD